MWAELGGRGVGVLHGLGWLRGTFEALTNKATLLSSKTKSRQTDIY